MRTPLGLPLTLGLALALAAPRSAPAATLYRVLPGQAVLFTLAVGLSVQTFPDPVRGTLILAGEPGDLRAEIGLEIDRGQGFEPWPVPTSPLAAEADGAAFAIRGGTTDGALDGRLAPIGGSPLVYRLDGVVSQLGTSTHYSVALDLELESATTGLLLDGNRFRVEARWHDFQGGSGTAAGVPITPGAGYLWFFDRDNPEILVKVLDACIDPFRRFWVFAAGLTNVELELRVTDLLTGLSRTYPNPAGTPFAPIQDTTTFATCDGL